VRRDEYREVLSRLDILEHDVADVKTRITDLHRTMDERFDRVNERFDRMNERFDEMYRHISAMTRWTVGTLALIGTIMTILMAIAQFT
jgi:chromosome segregation ATPase